MMTDRGEYQDAMECPMEDLCVAMYGLGKTSDVDSNLTDAQYVEKAARKITLLKRMLVSTGLSADLLQAIMEE